MNALDRLERLLQGMVERPAALLGARSLHPLAIAAELVRAMEGAALRLVDRIVVPDAYEVRLHPEDADRLSTVAATLQREYAEYLTRLTVERGLSLHAPISVGFRPSGKARVGVATIDARFSEPPTPTPRRPRRSSSHDVSGYTERALPRPTRIKVDHGAARLEVLTADGGVTREVSLNGAPLEIGRRSLNGLPLDDAEISRRHARIEPDVSGFCLRDLDSTNGTLLNGEAVHGALPLADGDVIELGRTRLRFRQGG